MYRARKPSFFDFLKSASATLHLIILTSILSVFTLILFAVKPETVTYFALTPSLIIQGTALWTIVTHMFIHGGLLHLFVNMFALFSLGGLCERIIGRKRFVWFYLVAGIGAGLLSAILAGFFGFGFLARIFGTPDAAMVGASGAIFGIAGLFVMLLPKVRFSIIFIPFFSLPAYVMVPLILVLTWIATIAANLPVGNVAHLGGFLIGLIYGYYLRVKYRKKVMLLDRHFR